MLFTVPHDYETNLACFLLMYFWMSVLEDYVDEFSFVHNSSIVGWKAKYIRLFINKHLCKAV